jgi:hypothetical protein
MASKHTESPCLRKQTSYPNSQFTSISASPDRQTHRQLALVEKAFWGAGINKCICLFKQGRLGKNTYRILASRAIYIIKKLEEEEMAVTRVGEGGIKF